MDALIKQAQQSSNRKDDVTWWSIPVGTSSIRIMPPWDPTGRVALPVHQHRIEYQDPSVSYKRYNWTCMKRTFEGNCPICDVLEEMRAAGIDTKEYDSSRFTYYMNILVMYDPLYENGVKSGLTGDRLEGLPSGTLAVSRIPKTIYDWVVSQITSPLVGDITSLDNGIDVYITKEGSGLGTKYTPTFSPNGRTAVPQQMRDSNPSLYDLSALFNRRDTDELMDGLVNKLRSSIQGFGGQVQGFQQTMSNGFGQNPYAVPNPYIVPNTTTPVPNTPPIPVAPPPAPVVPPFQPMTLPVVQPQNPVPPVVPAPPSAPQQMSIPVPPPVQVPTAPEAPAVTPVQAPPVVTPQPPQAPAPQTLQESIEGDKPKCFGNYNASDVKCVMCPYDPECATVSGK